MGKCFLKCSQTVIKTFDDNTHDNMITMMIICIMVSSHLFPPLLMALHNRYIQIPHKTYKTLELTENLLFEQRLKKITWILSSVVMNIIFITFFVHMIFEVCVK